MVDQNYDINTRDDLWRHYGGQASVGAALGITQGAVGNYTRRGIKPGWVARFICDLVQAGKTWNPEIFDLDDHPGAEILNRMISNHVRQ